MYKMTVRVGGKQRAVRAYRIKLHYLLPLSLLSYHLVIKSLEKEEVKWSELIANTLLLGAADIEVSLEIAPAVGVVERRCKYRHNQITATKRINANHEV